MGARELCQRRQTFACHNTPSEVILNHKSKSLSDILTAGQKAMVRSRSSVPSLGGQKACGADVAPPGACPPTASCAGGCAGAAQSAAVTVGSVEVLRGGGGSVPIAMAVVAPEAGAGAGCGAGAAAPQAKPRPLVKQKQSMCEEELAEDEDGDEPTDMRDLVKALPDFKISGHGGTGRRCGNVFKQSSMNEELMSAERLREKERVRQNIQKQASLNEELIYRRHRTLDSLRDTFFSTSTAKRLQLLKNGLTNKLKSSSAGIEKVAGTSFKNGFVRILQGWKGGEVTPVPKPTPPTPSSAEGLSPKTPPPDFKRTNSYSGDELSRRDVTKVGERRHSREDGSDSSKDSSLQSDTSVDSEDSFASVIFVPKAEGGASGAGGGTGGGAGAGAGDTASGSGGSALTTPSGSVTSPALPSQLSPPKSPQPTSPKVKMQPMSLSLANGCAPLPPPLPASYAGPPPTPPPRNCFEPPPPPPPPPPPAELLNENVQVAVSEGAVSEGAPTPLPPPPLLPAPTTSPSTVFSATTVACATSIPSSTAGATEEVEEDEDSELAAEIRHNERLRQIQELLRSRSLPGGSRLTASGAPARSTAFPLVRRSTALASARPLPRLLSLELFNPETDDMDSDSSGVSSPDSVSSVISVLTEEPVIGNAATVAAAAATGPAGMDATHADVAGKEVSTEETVCKEPLPTPPTPPPPRSPPTEPRTPPPPPVSVPRAPEIVRTSSEDLVLELCVANDDTPAPTPETTIPGVSPSTSSGAPDEPRISPSSHSLLEAAADVASSLEDAVDAVIQSSPRARRRKLQLMEAADPMSLIQGSYGSLNRSESYGKFSPGDMAPANKHLLSSGVGSNASPVADRQGSRVWTGSVDTSRRASPRRATPTAAPSALDMTSTEPDGHESWDESCRQHLAEFAEKLSEKLLEEIDQYRRQTCQPLPPPPSSRTKVYAGLPDDYEHIDDPYLSRLSEELEDLTKLSEELQRRNSYITNLNESSSAKNLELALEDTSAWRPKRDVATDSFTSPKTPSISVHDFLDRELLRDITVTVPERVEDHPEFDVNISVSSEPFLSDSNRMSSSALDVSSDVKLMDFANSETYSRQTSADITEDLETCLEDAEDEPGTAPSTTTTATTDCEPVTEKVSCLRPGYSMESSDAGDTASGSGKTASTTSLGPESSDAGSSDCSRDVRYADRRTARCDGRSSSEEAPLPPVGSMTSATANQSAATGTSHSGTPLPLQGSLPPPLQARYALLVRQEPPETLTKTESCASSLSGSTSQESLPSDNGGGAITFHRYYHVFREGELDQLIERYVENLHIISSYYDHANWCVVAEKVQVWTI